MASGTLTVDQAHRQISMARTDDGKRRKGGPRAEPLEVASDSSLFALDPNRFEAGRGVVLLVASNGEGRVELGEALSRHPDLGGMVAATLSMGLCLAERIGRSWRSSIWDGERARLRRVSRAVQPADRYCNGAAGSSRAQPRSPTVSRSRH